MQAIEARKRVPGDKHPNTLTIINNLAFMLRDLGSTGRAISLIEVCCELRVAILGL